MNTDYISSFEFIWDLFNSLWGIFTAVNIWVNLRLDEAIEAVLDLFPLLQNIDVPTLDITVLDICTSELLILFLFLGIHVFIWRAVKEFLPF